MACKFDLREEVVINKIEATWAVEQKPSAIESNIGVGVICLAILNYVDDIYSCKYKTIYDWFYIEYNNNMCNFVPEGVISLSYSKVE